MGKKIKCEVTTYRNDLIARLFLPDYIFIVPPHRGSFLGKDLCQKATMRSCG